MSEPEEIPRPLAVLKLEGEPGGEPKVTALFLPPANPGKLAPTTADPERPGLGT
ncbi:hypothetical protein FRC17_004140, partial [Serendipita sp. 399]